MTATIIVVSGFRASRNTSRRYFRCLLSLSPCYSFRSLHTSYPSHSPLHRYREMVEMTRRRVHGNGDSADKTKSPTGAVSEREPHDFDHNGLSNTQPQPHTHSHSHGIFGGHSHSHSHGHDGHDHGGGLIETLQSGGAHLCPIQLFCVYYDGLHVSHFFFCIASPSSLSLAIYRTVKVTEEVALHSLDWARMLF